jgi:hypothetical protein
LRFVRTERGPQELARVRVQEPVQVQVPELMQVQVPILR